MKNILTALEFHRDIDDKYITLTLDKNSTRIVFDIEKQLHRSETYDVKPRSNKEYIVNLKKQYGIQIRIEYTQNYLSDELKNFLEIHTEYISKDIADKTYLVYTSGEKVEKLRLDKLLLLHKLSHKIVNYSFPRINLFDNVTMYLAVNNIIEALHISIDMDNKT